jgi:hypothetical protein
LRCSRQLSAVGLEFTETKRTNEALSPKERIHALANAGNGEAGGYLFKISAFERSGED